MERILSVITVLGLICLCIGVLLYVAGRASDLFTVAQVGVFLLLIGAVLIGMRILYWIMEELVGRGLDSMGKQNALQTILEIQLKILPKVLKAYQCLHTVRAL